MKTVVAALLTVITAPAAALAQSAAADERFAAVTVATGEGVEVVATNVAGPILGGRPPAPCPITVEFFAGSGKPIGATATLHLPPGVSGAAAAPAPGLVRARVALVGIDTDAVCAVRGELEIYDLKGGATRFIVPGGQCLGRAACAAPIQ